MLIGYCVRKLPPYVNALVNSPLSVVQNERHVPVTQTAPKTIAPVGIISTSIATRPASHGMSSPDSA